MTGTKSPTGVAGDALIPPSSGSKAEDRPRQTYGDALRARAFCTVLRTFRQSLSLLQLTKARA